MGETRTEPKNIPNKILARTTAVGSAAKGALNSLGGTSIIS